MYACFCLCLTLLHNATVGVYFYPDRVSEEVLAVGVNAVCEIVRRVPLVMEGPEMQPLVEDLVDRSKSRDRSVMDAARGFLNLVCLACRDNVLLPNCSSVLFCGADLRTSCVCSFSTPLYRMNMIADS